MVSQRRQNKEYYAVVSGRIDTPTIFSSWYLPLIYSGEKDTDYFPTGVMRIHG